MPIAKVYVPEDLLTLPPDPARRLFVTIIETAEGGFGVNGQVFTPARK